MPRAVRDAAGRGRSAGLEMADAACPVSLCARRYNLLAAQGGCCPRESSTSGGCGVWRGWRGALRWGGKEQGAAGGGAPLQLAFRRVLCLPYASCLSLPGTSAVGLGAGSSSAGQSCAWLGHAGSSPGFLLEDPAQLWLVGEAASPALCRAARLGDGIWRCKAGRAELGWLGLGASFPQHGHGVRRVPCCVAAEGDPWDSHQNLVSPQVAVQDQLARLPQLLRSLPWGCRGS